MTQTSIIQDIQELLKTLPEPLQTEALHYVEYLSSRYAHQELYLERGTTEPVNTNSARENPTKRSGFGIWKGKISMAEDFDAPLEEFEEYM
jgi:hypothetical protein